MTNDTNQMIVELWERIKYNIPAKERLDTADKIMNVFDEYGMVDREVFDCDLDPHLLAAATALFCDAEIEDEDEPYDDEE